jgi:hypothetical protein
LPPTLVAAPRSTLFESSPATTITTAASIFCLRRMAACRLFHQEEDGSFRDVTQAAGLGGAGGARAAAFRRRP